MSWPGESQRHSMSSRGISTTGRQKPELADEKYNLARFFEIALRNTDIDLSEVTEADNWIFEDGNDNQLKISLYRDSNGDVHIDRIDAKPTGTGMGTIVINVLKHFSNMFSLTIHANDVTNEKFWKKMGFKITKTEIIEYEHSNNIKMSFYEYKGGVVR